ncbi:anthrone oxygenase family protein [Tsukamurella paurometabola]|uniref:Integral membrane protein n=1 Tax=Tsukamurella paurometabola (strain ATCC 8368 / DSM 20162 / CCUG 35730 / CIP 100753 / JCM 10117 / KCTC 9821 / NBRC 16120 / NCIMB 702349 / NCTC 13040) TaxID=521096 RepID=D5UUZ4_TSUPD|nr:anthrone oxygenase family protein [Tsukamurella paurometabola]ADG79712.1 Protein of unknown function DUF2266, transmembrane [Tsukamurella paurometabola DSM 20162]SUP36892.1 Predicted integral membrane protein [Tsukamurella paurometabola]
MTMHALLVAAALVNAVLAGFYFAYATVIAGQRGQADGGAAMVRMNAAVERPPFIALFLLAPVLAVAAALWCLVAGGPDAPAIVALIAAVCAVAACVSTMAVNVPLNQRLAAGTVDWAQYAGTWGTWNVARTWLCAAGAAGLGFAALG